MNIITPQNAAMSPSGGGGANEVAGSFSVGQNVAADFTVAAFTIATIPADGQYQFVGCVSFRNGTADPPPSTFFAEFDYVDGAGNPVGPATFLGITGGLDQAALVAGTSPTVFTALAGSVVQISYGATGITGGSVDVVVSAVVTRLA